MRWLLMALLLPLTAQAKPTKRHPTKRAAACPFVGLADVMSSGEVNNLVGLSLNKARSLLAFDVDGPAGKLWGSSSGLRFIGGVPSKISNSTFTHVLLVDAKLKGLHVAQAGKDLPEGIFADAVQIYLADRKGGRVAVVSIPGQTQADACSEIDCKVGGAWKRCWTDCRAAAPQPVLTP